MSATSARRYHKDSGSIFFLWNTIWGSGEIIAGSYFQAYFGGEARCDAEAGQGDDYDPSELICGACSDVSRAQVGEHLQVWWHCFGSKHNLKSAGD